MSTKDLKPPQAREYQPPRVTSHTAAELLELLGPAQGYGAGGGGGTSSALGPKTSNSMRR